MKVQGFCLCVPWTLPNMQEMALVLSPHLTYLGTHFEVQCQKMALVADL